MRKEYESGAIEADHEQADMAHKSKSFGFPRWGGYGTDSETVHLRMCDYDGCSEVGEHPAPKSPGSRERWHFCQHHAALYNRNWNFFEGMTGEEAAAFEAEQDRMANGYHASSTWSWQSRADASTAEREALATLELEEGASQGEIKAQFRRLAKKYHPDTTGGSEEGNRKFQQVRKAYEFLATRRPAPDNQS